MGTTTNYSIPYPDLTDETDGASQMQALAVATDTELKVLADAIDDLASAPGGGEGGGGEGGTISRGRWSAVTAQTVASGSSVVAAFGTDLESSADWVKVTRGSGHGFRAQRAGVLRGALVLRYATTTASGVRDVHIRKGTDYVGSSGGGAVAGQPRHHSVAILPQPIAEGDEVWVDLFNGTGSTRQLEPNGGQWVQLSLELA